jgi:hypothetical protein
MLISRRKRKIKAQSARALARQATKLIKDFPDLLKPHELLWLWSNGIKAAGIVPDPTQRIHCAIAAANYFAPKYSNIEIKQDIEVKSVISAKPLSNTEWIAKYASTTGHIDSIPASIEIPSQVKELSYVPEEKEEGEGNDEEISQDGYGGLEGIEGVPRGDSSKTQVCEDVNSAKLLNANSAPDNHGFIVRKINRK